MTPEGRPLVQLFRSDVVLKLYNDGDSYTLVVARIRSKPEQLDGLTAEEALHRLAAAARPVGD